MCLLSPEVVEGLEVSLSKQEYWRNSSILFDMSETGRVLEQQLWDFVYAYDAAFDRAAQDAGLTAAQACLLTTLSEGSRMMGDLATELLCDASNVTQLVDDSRTAAWSNVSRTRTTVARAG